ncbi:hypothetical protein [Sulfurospirillum sp. 1612]|uniref:hypothetical protein n=1 Tax=Sulfurospirillum sp. 1612 TaxID=3094835 RepID=UPI002F95D17B
MERNLFLLVVLIAQCFGGDTFWFSYKSVTSNQILVEEEKNISPLVVPYNGKISRKCHVPIHTHIGETNLQKLNKNFDNILPCFYQSDTIVTSRSVISKNKSYDIVEVVIAPIRFIVDFKDDFANISILKKE